MTMDYSSGYLRSFISDNTESVSVPVMAFVPEQTFAGLYAPDEALRSGTLFISLNKPFEGKGCKHCGCNKTF